jgi:DNA-binding NarL/FixJ family response regulator
MKKIRIIIIDDNSLLRKGIKKMLRSQEDFFVLAAFGDRINALEKIISLNPDILLLDLGLENQNSLELVKSIKKKLPETNVIIMDLVPIRDDILRFVEAGASGFIIKDETIPEFLNTIRSVANGDKLLPPVLAGTLFSQVLDYGIKALEESKLIQSVRMTESESEIIKLIAGGLTHPKIAKKLKLSIHIVNSHIHNILEKMALNNRLQNDIYNDPAN